jgi:primosomal protein N' (replication factor Y)
MCWWEPRCSPRGLDLPKVTLVVVLAADGLLHLGDYRAQERAAQTLVQVAGRAGRGEQPGEVIIQTYSDDHPVLTAVRHYQYPEFLDQELQSRRELGYPPWGRLILLRLSGLDAGLGRANGAKISITLAGRSLGMYRSCPRLYPPALPTVIAGSCY